MGTLLHSSVEVCEPIELLFGVVTVVSPGIGEYCVITAIYNLHNISGLLYHVMYCHKNKTQETTSIDLMLVSKGYYTPNHQIRQT